MTFVTDSNRPQPLWQPPPTACLTAAGAASEVPTFPNTSLPHPPPLPPEANARPRYCGRFDAPHPLRHLGWSVEGSPGGATEGRMAPQPSSGWGAVRVVGPEGGISQMGSAEWEGVGLMTEPLLSPGCVPSPAPLHRLCQAAQAWGSGDRAPPTARRAAISQGFVPNPSPPSRADSRQDSAWGGRGARGAGAQVQALTPTPPPPFLGAKMFERSRPSYKRKCRNWLVLQAPAGRTSHTIC